MKKSKEYKSDSYKKFESWLKRNRWRFAGKTKSDDDLEMIAWCGWCAGSKLDKSK